MRQIKRPHLKNISPAEAASKLLGEISRQAFQQNIAVFSAILPLLLELHDATADFPIRRGEDGVDGAGGLPARLRQQRRDAARPRAVIRPPRAVARASGGGILSLGRTGFHGIKISGKLRREVVLGNQLWGDGGFGHGKI